MLQGEHSAILLTFIKLSIVIKIFVLSILEWPFYTGFTVYSVLVFEMFNPKQIYILAVCGRVPFLLKLGNCLSLLTIRTEMLRYSVALTHTW